MIGLKERIERANTEPEIAALLLEGGNYTQATDKTKRKWSRAANQRITFLENYRKAHKV